MLPHFDAAAYARFIQHIQLSRGDLNRHSRLCLGSTPLQALNYKDAPLPLFSGNLTDIPLKPTQQTYLQHMLRGNYSIFDMVQPLHKFNNVPLEVVVRIRDVHISLSQFIPFELRFALFTQENADLVQISDWSALDARDELDKFVFEIDQSLLEQRIVLVCILERPFSQGRDMFYELFEQAQREAFSPRNALFGFGLDSDYSQGECEVILQSRLAMLEFGGARQLAYIAYAELSFATQDWELERIKLDFCITRPKVKVEGVQDIISASYTDHHADEIPILIAGDWEIANVVGKCEEKSTILDKLYNFPESTSFGGDWIRRTYFSDKIADKSEAAVRMVGSRPRDKYLGWQEQVEPRNIVRVRASKLELWGGGNAKVLHYYLIFSIFGGRKNKCLFSENGQMVSHIISEVINIEKVPEFMQEVYIVLGQEELGNVVLSVSLFQIPEVKSGKQRQYGRDGNFGLYGKEIGSACITIVDSDLCIQNPLNGLDAIVFKSHASMEVARIGVSFEFSISTFNEKSANDDTIIPSYILTNLWMLYANIIIDEDVDYCALTAVNITEICERHFSTLLKSCYLLYINIIFDTIIWIIDQDERPYPHSEEYEMALMLLIQMLKRFEGNPSEVISLEYQARLAFCDLTNRYKKNATFKTLTNKILMQSEKTAFVQAKPEAQTANSLVAETSIPNQQFIYLMQNIQFSKESITSFYANLPHFVENRQRMEKQDYIDFVIFGSEILLQLDLAEAGHTLRTGILNFYRLILVDQAFEKHIASDAQTLDLIAFSIAHFLSSGEEFVLWDYIFVVPDGSEAELKYYSGIVLRVCRRVLEYLLPDKSTSCNFRGLDYEIKQQIVSHMVTDGFLRLNLKVLEQESIFEQELFEDYLISFMQFLEQFVLYFLQFDTLEGVLQEECELLYQILSRIVTVYMEESYVQDVIQRCGVLPSLLASYMYFLNNALTTQVSVIIRQVHVRFLVNACLRAYDAGFSTSVTLTAWQEIIICTRGDIRCAYGELSCQSYNWSENLITESIVCDNIQMKAHEKVQLAVMNLLLNDILHVSKYYFRQRLQVNNLIETSVLESFVQVLQFKYIDFRNISFVLGLLYAQLDQILRSVSAQFNGSIFGRPREVESLLEITDYYIGKQLFLDFTKQIWLILIRYYALEVHQVLEIIHLLMLYDYVVFSEKGGFDLTFTMAYSVIYSNNERFYDETDKCQLDKELDRLISPLVQLSAYYSHKIDNSAAESGFTSSLIEFMLNMKNILEETLKQTRDAIEKIDGRPYTDFPRLFESYSASIALYDQKYEIGIEQYTRIFQKLEEEKIHLECAFWYLRAALFVSQFTTLPASHELLRLSYAGGADIALLHEYLRQKEIPLCHAVYGFIRQITPGTTGNRVANECQQDDERYRQLIFYLKSAENLFMRMEMVSYYVQLDIFLAQLHSIDEGSRDSPIAIKIPQEPGEPVLYRDKDTYYLIVLHGKYISDAFNDKLYIYHYKSGMRIEDVEDWFKNYYNESYAHILAENRVAPPSEGIVEIMGEYDFRARIQNLLPHQLELAAGPYSGVPKNGNRPAIRTSPELARARESLENLIPSRRGSEYAMAGTQPQQANCSLYMARKRAYKCKLYISIMATEPFVFFSAEEEFIEGCKTSRYIQAKVSQILGLQQFLSRDKSETMAQFDYRSKFAGFSRFTKQQVLTSIHVFTTSQKYVLNGRDDDPEAKGQIIAYYILANPLPSVHLREEVSEEVQIYYPPMIVQSKYIYEQAQKLNAFLKADDQSAQRANQIQSSLISIFHSNVSLGSRKFYDLFSARQTDALVCSSLSSSQQVDPDGTSIPDLAPFARICSEDVLELNLTPPEQYAIFQKAVGLLVESIKKCLLALQEILRLNPGVRDTFEGVYQNLMRETDAACSALRERRIPLQE